MLFRAKRASASDAVRIEEVTPTLLLTTDAWAALRAATGAISSTTARETRSWAAFRAATAASATLEAALASAMAVSRLGQKAKEESPSPREVLEEVAGDSVREPGAGGDERGEAVEGVDSAQEAADGLVSDSFRKLITPFDALSAIATASSVAAASACRSCETRRVTMGGRNRDVCACCCRP